jgi:hypothetical protein
MPSQAQDHAKSGFQLRPSKQEFATSDMGRKNGQFALQKF